MSPNQYITRVAQIQDAMTMEMFKAGLKETNKKSQEEMLFYLQESFESYLTVLHETTAKDCVDLFKHYIINMDSSAFREIPSVFIRSKSGAKIIKNSMHELMDRLEKTLDLQFNHIEKEKDKKLKDEQIKSLSDNISDFVQFIQYLEKKSYPDQFLDLKMRNKIKDFFVPVFQRSLMLAPKNSNISHPNLNPNPNPYMDRQEMFAHMININIEALSKILKIDNIMNENKDEKLNLDNKTSHSINPTDDFNNIEISRKIGSKI